MSTEGQFMSIAEAVTAVGAQNKSFEEVRIDDYLKSYMTRGRPPSPVPQLPEDDFTRKTLGLPPLFKPHLLSFPPADGNINTTGAGLLSGLGGGSLLRSSASSSTLVGGGALGKPRIMDPAQLPAAQVLTPTPVSGEKFYVLSAMSEFGFYSLEELRYYAYLAGNKTLPTGVDPQPFMVERPVLAPAATGTGTKVDGESMENLVARPGYEKHSPEEFRVAYMMYGREMNSAELAAVQPAAAAPVAPVPATNPLVPAPTLATIPSTSALRAQPTVLFGSTATTAPTTTPATTTVAAPALSSTPSTGMFTFGFRPR